jgi:hypothetical protein
MKATEAAYLGLLQLKIIIGLLKFRIFSNSPKGSIKSGSHFSAKLTKKHGFPHRHRQLNIVRLSRSIQISATRDTSDAVT